MATKTQRLVRTNQRCMPAWIVAVVLGAASLAQGQLPDLEPAAKKLIDCVVTLRVTFPGTADPKTKQPRIVVCSGAVVDPQWVVAPIFAGADSTIRITMPGGRQVEGSVRVLDEYSGLAMVRLSSRTVNAFALSEQAPSVGAWILSAAGWGIERPVVSLGIVSALNRTDPGLGYPPMLQCDLRAASTSTGAAVVDRTGDLLGIVVATGKDTDRGWTFAVPVDHVRRLLRVAKDGNGDSRLTILKRRRPEVGMVLDGQPDAVRVSRLTRGGPADRAGIEVGDRIVAVNGMHIRSVYQAVRPVIVLQPGDRVTFTIQRGELTRDVPVVLGGGVALPSGRLVDVTRFIQPKVDFSTKDWQLAQLRTTSHLSELGAAPESPPAQAGQEQAMALLEKSLERYQQAIRAMQTRLKESESERRKLEAQIDELRRDLERLEKSQHGKPP